MTFEIPIESIPEGLSYEWKRWSVTGDHDPTYIASLKRNGWEPVNPKTHPDLVPPGHDGLHIIIGGMILMQRSIELTKKSEQEYLESFLRTMKDLKERLEGKSDGFKDVRYNREADKVWLDEILNVDDATEELATAGSVIITVPARVRLSPDQQDAAQITYPGVSKTKAHVAYARQIVQMQIDGLDLYAVLLQALLDDGRR